MQYIKHYYVNDVTGEYMTTTNDAPAKRHPVKEIPGLGVKFWSHDPDGIDVCVSEVEADQITITDQEVDGKFAVKTITEEQYNNFKNQMMTSRLKSRSIEIEKISDIIEYQTEIQDPCDFEDEDDSNSNSLKNNSCF